MHNCNQKMYNLLLINFKLKGIFNNIKIHNLINNNKKEETRKESSNKIRIQMQDKIMSLILCLQNKD